ncbi:MAG TPA: LysE family transporter [Afifellaceae bacterium]|nr:LysE family transporter [Afifellaceae bacterium]
MTALGYILLGFFVGMAVSMPVGAVAVMCARRAFQNGVSAGISPGIGAALADTLFAAIAAFGIATIADDLRHYADYLQVVGGGLLIAYGWNIVAHADRLPKGPPPSKRNAVQAATAAFLLTVTNPGAVLGFAALFTLLGDLTPESGNVFGVFALVIGVAAGALTWWMILSALVGLLRRRMAEDWLVRINRGAGVALAGIGAAILLRLMLLPLI